MSAAESSAATIGLSSSRCLPVGSKTLAIEAHARVYSLPMRGPDAEQDPEGVRVFGCLLGTGHATRLGTTRFVRSADPAKQPINPKVAAVAAPFAAYSTSFQGVDFNRVWAIVRNLNTGEVLQTAGAAPKVGVEPESAVTDMAVSHSGTVAWISRGSSLGNRRRNLEVALSVPNQPAETLEEGGGIDPESLQLHGNRLTWTNEGTRHSAEMP